MVGRAVNPYNIYAGKIPGDIQKPELVTFFSKAGQVVAIKLFKDKYREGFNYAFVEYANKSCVDTALRTFKGVKLHNQELKIDVAYETQIGIRHPGNFNIFVGDLSRKVNDAALYKAFAKFGNLAEARVMWDMNSGQSRGYGFVSFTDNMSAQQAMREMDGKPFFSRVIRCNWADQNSNMTSSAAAAAASAGLMPCITPIYYISTATPPDHSPQLQQQPIDYYASTGYVSPYSLNSSPQMTGVGSSFVPTTPPMMSPSILVSAQQPNMTLLTYETMLKMSPHWQTYIYIGNLSSNTNTKRLYKMASTVGHIVSFKDALSKGYAFVQYRTHEEAAMAIVRLTGMVLDGKLLKCSWPVEKRRPT